MGVVNNRDPTCPEPLLFPGNTLPRLPPGASIWRGQDLHDPAPQPLLTGLNWASHGTLLPQEQF